MKGNVCLIASALALTLGTSGLVAQDAAQARPNADQKSVDQKKVTVTGCIERADQVMSRENLATTVDSLDFVLMKADKPDAAAQPTGTAGANANPADKEKGFGIAYRLEGNIDTINPHVGHRVEVVGSVAAAAPSGASGNTGAVGTAGRVPAGADVPADAPVLKVESVKMIASTCGR
jgi:hypothetical protein